MAALPRVWDVDVLGRTLACGVWNEVQDGVCELSGTLCRKRCFSALDLRSLGCFFKRARIYGAFLPAPDVLPVRSFQTCSSSECLETNNVLAGTFWCI